MHHALTALPLLVAAAFASTPSDAATLGYLGQQVLPTATQFLGTQVGGLSGLDFNPVTGGYVAISDDRSTINPARYYDLSLDVSRFARSNNPGSAGVQLTHVTTLLAPDGNAFPSNGVDPESIRLRQTPSGGTSLLWTSEGLRSGATFQAPTLREATTAGVHLRDFAVPSYFLPTGSAAGNQPGDSGIRNNLAFESLTLSLDGTRAYIATENALVQDGPRTTLTGGSPSRVAEFSIANGQRTAEFVYRAEPITNAPVAPGVSADSGLVELLAIGDRQFIALERSFAEGVGFTSRLFLADARGATDVAGHASIGDVADLQTMSKSLLLDLSSLRNDDGSPLAQDNIEGITFGPMVDGKRTLILVSDNNFNNAEFTQFVALSVDGELTSPVPEPQTAALWALGLGLIAVARKSTRRA